MKSTLRLWFTTVNVFRLSLSLIVVMYAGIVQADNGVIKELLTGADRSWEGTSYKHYPEGRPYISVLKVTFKPDSELNWHSHPCISAVYLSSGSLTLVTEVPGAEHEFHAGEAFTDTVDTLHKGKAGKKGAELLVFFACTRANALSIEGQSDEVRNILRE